MKPQNFKLITFDCYGTLIDWPTGIYSALSSLVEAAGITASKDLVYEAYVDCEAGLEKPPWRPYADLLQTAVERLGVRFGFEVNEENRRSLLESLPTWIPFADTNDALKRLKARYKLAILSNIDRDMFTRTARHFEIEFDWIVTAEDVRSYKPAHGHFERITRLSGYAPDEILHAAQSLYHDIVPCRQMRRPCAWINRRRENNTTAATPDMEFPTVAALADALCA